MNPSIMKRYIRIPLLVISLVLQIGLFGQSHLSLQKILDSTRRIKDDSTRLLLNSQFYNQLVDTINSPDFNSSSIKNLKIGQPNSVDKKMIFYNWNIQQNNGQNVYSAVVYLPKSHNIITLPQKISPAKLLNDSVYPPNDWPGGLYYKIITPDKKGVNYYLLLGWDRFNRQTSRKTIEAITIMNDSTIIFGKEVFKTKEGYASRVILEYAATANMTLNYSKQKLTLTGVRKSQSHINDSIIIIDRLMPLNATLEGERWAYVPVGNIYDGYIFFKNYWTFVEGINARNPAIKREGRKKDKRPDLDLLPKQ